MSSIRQEFTVRYRFDILFTHNVFDPDNPTLSDVLEKEGGDTRRILVVLDSGVAEANSSLWEKMQKYRDSRPKILEFVGEPLIIQGGERCKQGNDGIDKIYKLVNHYHICRHSFILAIGGGALLDIAGYAAATSHRGVRLIRMPTTVLAQNDAGIGVKNGFNLFGRKNFVGTFAPPFAVIDDYEFLKTLSPRDVRSGIAEAVKVAIIQDKKFFEFLWKHRKKLGSFEQSVLEEMIYQCARLHSEHIAQGGDPFESGSARPLDFGHWIAHKLEERTRGDLRHGEAVAIGIALDSLYAYHSGLLRKLELNKIWAILQDIGFALYHEVLDSIDCAEALMHFREHLGGILTITLPQGIGNRLDVHEINMESMRSCVEELSRNRLRN